ncbi:MAG: YncE family protein [Thaumarchaeota archaeon]|nr:YncE family protein [Nitrososphaerota archaeon]
MQLGRRPGISTKLAATAVIVLIAIAFAGYEYLQQPHSRSSSTSSSSSFAASASGASTASTLDYALLSDHSFQLINATVTSSGGKPAIIVAYRSDVPEPVNALLVGVPYVATDVDSNASAGSPGGIVCCPILSSISNVTLPPVSVAIAAKPEGEAASTLLFGSIPDGVYSIQVYVTSPDESKVLSPMSRVFVDATNSSHVCGGEEAPGSTFFDPDNGLLYVANDGTDSITVINASTDQVSTTISLPSNEPYPSFYLYDPGNKELYLGVEGTNPTFVIDTETNFLVANITLPLVAASPNDTSLESMVYDPSDGKIFAINFVSDLVTVIDGTTNKAVSEISGIEAPWQGAYDPKNGDIYVQAGNGTIYVVDGSTYQITGSISDPGVQDTPGGLVYDQDSGLFYFAYDVQLPASPLALFLSTINASSNTLSQQTININGTWGALLFYDSFNRDLYFRDGATLVAFSTESNGVVATIPLPGVYSGPCGAEGCPQSSAFYDTTNGDIYVADNEVASGDIGIIHVSADSNTVVSKTFLPPTQLGNLAFDWTNGKVFAGGGPTVNVLDTTLGNVSMISVGSCKYTIPSVF